MFDGVPKQVLEEFAQSAPVGFDRQAVDDDEVTRVERLPAGPRERLEVDGFGVAEAAPLPGESEQVVDEFRHPVVALGDGGEVLAVALLAGEFEPPLGDVQRVAEVV